MRTLLSLCLVGACSPGCSLFLHGQSGPVVGTSGSVGGSVELTAGVGAHDTSEDSNTGLGLDLSLRGRFDARTQSAGLGIGAYGLYQPHPRVFLFGRLGAHALQLDFVQGSPSLSALSPYLTLGVGLPLLRSRSAGPALTIGLGAAYDVQFARPGEGLFGLTLGVAGFPDGRRAFRVPIGG